MQRRYSLSAPPSQRPLSALAVTERLVSVDVLRGLVIVLMALDHTRYFFGSAVDLHDSADPALFLTRWITHLCAPTFIFLAGLSAYLFGVRAGKVGQTAKFLLARGVFLILIEFTLVGFAWNFNVEVNQLFAGVIWAIGASMIVLAGLVYLQRLAILLFGLALVAGHNLLDGVHSDALGQAGWLWHILHEQGPVHAGPVTLYVFYPLIPWIGVMALGYALGPLMLQDPAERQRQLLTLGLIVTASFLLLRAINLYGDPGTWAIQDSLLDTVFAFINCKKYPPSLLYLLMTLGPALILLALFDGARGLLASWLATFGRVPFFFYVTHLYLIHALALGFALATVSMAVPLSELTPLRNASRALSLPSIYLIWVLVLLLLYPLCRWFAGLKAQRSEWWLRYL